MEGDIGDTGGDPSCALEMNAQVFLATVEGKTVVLDLKPTSTIQCIKIMMHVGFRSFPSGCSFFSYFIYFYPFDSRLFCAVQIQIHFADQEGTSKTSFCLDTERTVFK